MIGVALYVCQLLLLERSILVSFSVGISDCGIHLKTFLWQNSQRNPFFSNQKTNLTKRLTEICLNNPAFPHFQPEKMFDVFTSILRDTTCNFDLTLIGFCIQLLIGSIRLQICLPKTFFTTLKLPF
jgi:hypothetical protein